MNHPPPHRYKPLLNTARVAKPQLGALGSTLQCILMLLQLKMLRDGMEKPVIPHLNIRDDPSGGVHVVHAGIGKVYLDPSVLPQTGESGTSVVCKGGLTGGRQGGAAGLGIGINADAVSFWVVEELGRWA